MLSKKQITFINSLKIKKFRELHRCFLAEGARLIRELSASRFRIRHLYATDAWIEKEERPGSFPVTGVTWKEMTRITALASPSPVLAIVEMPEHQPDPVSWTSDYVLALDDIQDPGNLGTIIRVADWFGIREVICSATSVDLYNPKVIQATMGSIARVAVTYLDLPSFFEALTSSVPVIGMVLEGKDFYREETITHGIILIGNEAHGISEKLMKYLTHRLTIPSYPSGRKDHAESLNAAVATGIVCAALRRRDIKPDSG